MIIGLLCSFKTCQIDFSNAFVQAELEEPVYLQLPQGYKADTDNIILELHKSLYGQIEALVHGMESIKMVLRIASSASPSWTHFYLSPTTLLLFVILMICGYGIQIMLLTTN